MCVLRGDLFGKIAFPPLANIVVSVVPLKGKSKDLSKPTASWRFKFCCLVACVCWFVFSFRRQRILILKPLSNKWPASRSCGKAKLMPLIGLFCVENSSVLYCVTLGPVKGLFGTP